MYPYSKEGIARCLKEVCKTESPVIPETFECYSTQGIFGGKAEGEYHFATNDGKRYLMIVEGRLESDLFSSIRYEWTNIKSIEKLG